MAAGQKGGLGGGSSGDKPTRNPARKYKAGDIIPYGTKAKTKGLDRHEVLQNLWLKVQEVIEKRGKGMGSRLNPTVLLPPNVHRIVSRYQRALGLFDRSKIAELSYKQVLSLNALALQHAGLPQSIIEDILDEALEHAIFSLARGY
jgi:hypothetical protein